MLNLSLLTDTSSSVLSVLFILLPPALRCSAQRQLPLVFFKIKQMKTVAWTEENQDQTCFAARRRPRVRLLAGGLSAWSVHVLPVHSMVLSGYSGFLPQSKSMTVRLTGLSKLPLLVGMVVCLVRHLLRVYSASRT
ncbi:hypothetical protein ILYODFUR_035546 [Ilyodon furcidens]|uniref:Rhodanese domain-containing protein n=1 Tax=Ilyodon furcidens TaxID=33524 RepID=A0ABV0UBH9_9TELE